MHIVSVAHSYPRWDGDVAGAFVERLVLALQQRSHSVSVIAPSDQGKCGTSEHHGVTVNRVRYAPKGMEVLAYTGRMTDAVGSATGLATFAALIAMQAGATLREVDRSRADIVHAHWWIPGGVSACLASLVRRVPVIVTLHGTDVAVLERSNAVRRLARVVLRRAAGVTSVSSFLAKRAASVADIDPGGIVVQPMPLDVERYARNSTGGAGVVTVGRLVRQKRIAALIESVALLHQRGNRVPLTVIGDGPERRSLE